MVTDVLPLRAIVLQCLLLVVSIAIEATVLFRLLRTENNRPSLTPKQSIQYATSVDFLSAVLGWFMIFSFFNWSAYLPPGWVRNIEVPLFNLLFFNQYSNQSLSFLIVGGFFTFFASFLVKQVGLWGLQWLLRAEFPRVLPETALDSDKASIVGIRDLRRDSSDANQLNISAVLFANAWSYSAILVILLLLAL